MYSTHYGKSTYINIMFRGRELCMGDETLHSALDHPWGFNHL